MATPGPFRQTTLPLGMGPSTSGKRDAAAIGARPEQPSRNGSCAWVWNSFTAVSPEDAAKHHIVIKDPYRCNFCAADATSFKTGVVTGANVSRMKEHLLNRRVCTFLFSPAAEEIAHKVSCVKTALNDQPRASASTSSARSIVSKGFKPDVVTASEKTRLDELLVSMLVHCMFSFLAVENPAFIAMFAAIRPAYKLPTRRMVAGRLLLTLYQTQLNQVRAALSSAQYVHLTMDGWSRTQGADHLLGFCAAMFGVTYFLDFLEVGANSCTAKFLKASFHTIVNKWGLADKAASLITDTPSSMKACWRLLVADYPKLQCLCCWMHVLNLTFKNICDESAFIKSKIAEAADMTNFFKRQQLNHGLLDKHRRQLNIKKGLDEAGATRFSYHYNLLDSLIKNKPAIQAAVVDSDFRGGTSNASKQRSSTIKKLALDDTWWQQLSFIAGLLKPLKTAIQLVQADNCTQGDCLFIWRKMAADITTAHELITDEELIPEVEAVIESLATRFDYGFSPMMILSALLHPKYRLRDNEISAIWRQDAEYLIEVLGSELLRPNTNKGPECVRRQPYLTDQHGKKVRSQFFRFRTRKQDVGMLLAPFDGPEVENATLWWQQYGDECKELQRVALRCFPPASAAGGERVFSALGSQWTKKRSTLSMCKASMLTYVFFNSRAMAHEEMPQMDWVAFYDSLQNDDDDDVDEVVEVLPQVPEDRAEQMALAEQMATAQGEEMLTHEASP